MKVTSINVYVWSHVSKMVSNKDFFLFYFCENIFLHKLLLLFVDCSNQFTLKKKEQNVIYSKHLLHRNDDIEQILWRHMRHL